jgi:hypothetical protein
MTTQTQSAPKARVAVLGALALLACGWALASASHPTRPAHGATQAPPLEVAAQTCPPTGDAHERARDAEAAAAARIARYPFEAAEGLAALRELARAAACFERAAEAEALERVRMRARTWRHELERDYRGARVRLERALRDDRTEHARTEARTLLALLDGMESAYTQRLRAFVDAQPRAKGEKP